MLIARYLSIVVASFCIGIMSYQSSSLLCLFVIGCGTCMLFLQRWPLQQPISVAIVCMLSIAIGFLCIHQETTKWRYALSSMIGTRSLIATVVDITHYTTRTGKSMHMLTVDVSAVQRQHWQSIAARVLLYIEAPPTVAVGDCLLLTGNTITAPRNRIHAWLQTKSLAATVYLKKLDAIYLCNINSIAITCTRLRHAIIKELTNYLSPRAMTLLQSLFLGCKTEYDPILQELFGRWGLNHILARSGLHLMILIGLWRPLLQLLLVPYRLQQLLLMILVIAFVMLTPPSNSLNRAWLMTILQSVTIINYRISSALYALNMTVMLLLTNNPTILYALDFQLTVALTYALILLR
ncbi:ComEC/Rec2 family competence protein [Candidatus Dependentiae bacterium]|nr:ComEC/Rec2 family competence protein [Candidatus Dependentiae bacterium]